jgi:tRNA-Thr(GGU) m(6)t(6)A37 methyltransferase TsaA
MDSRTAVAYAAGLSCAALLGYAAARYAAATAGGGGSGEPAAEECGAECWHARELQAERAGRASAQKAMRAMVNARSYGEGEAEAAGPAPGYACLPIGTVESTFVRRSGTPRQGLLAPDARATVVLSPAISAACLRGLAEYSHVFLLFLFHENTDAHKKGGGGGGSVEAALQARPFAALIAAPALGGEKTGVFATRSPHRPNAIGLSLVRLLAVTETAGSGPGGKGGRRALLVSGCDLVAGTPVIDIKPYAPYDCPSCMGALMTGKAGPGPELAPVARTHSLPNAFEPPTSLAEAEYSLVHGGSADPSAFSLAGPSWSYSTLADLASSRLPVVWGQGCAEAVRRYVAEGGTRFYGPGAKGSGGLVEEGSALLRAIAQALALDVRAVHQGRGKAARAKGEHGWGGAGGEGSPLQPYELFFDTLRVGFTFRGGVEGERLHVHVQEVGMRMRLVE